MKKNAIIFLYIITSVSAILLILALLIQFVFDKQVENYLQSVVHASKQADERFTTGSLHFNLFTRCISVFQLSYEKGDKANPFIRLKLDTLELKGLSLFSFLFKKEITINHLYASDGQCFIDINKKTTSGETDLSVHISHFLAKRIQWDVRLASNKASFVSEQIAATSFNIPSAFLVPSESFRTDMTNIQLSYQQRTLQLDSLYIFKYNGFTDLRLGPVSFNDLSDFIGLKRDPISFPIRRIVAEKLIATIPLYYFPYLSSSDISFFELPYIEILRPEIYIQTGLGAMKSKERWNLSLTGQPVDYIIHKLRITDATIRTYHRNDTLPVFTLDKFSLKTLNLRTDRRFKSYPFYCDALDFSGENMLIQLNPYLKFTCSVQKIGFYNTSNEMRVDNLTIHSELPPDTFFTRYYYQTDKPNLFCRTIALRKIDFCHLLNNNEFFIGLISVDSLSLQVMRDRNYPYDLKSYPPMLQDQIKQLPFTYSVDTCLMKKGMIEYLEIPKGFDIDGAGLFRFTNVSLSTHNLTNAIEKLEQNDTLEIHFTGKLYNQGELNAFVDMPLLNTDYQHRVYGTIGKFNAKEFNKLTVPTAAIKINRGTINGGEFYFEANNRRSRGEAKLLFEKLKLAILNQGGHASKSQPDFLKSIITNVFITHENPIPGKPAMIGEIRFERNMNRWMINFWWKSLLHGLKSIVFARENEVKAMSTSFSEYQQLRKQREEREKTENPFLFKVTEPPNNH